MYYYRSPGNDHFAMSSVLAICFTKFSPRARLRRPTAAAAAPSNKRRFALDRAHESSFCSSSATDASVHLEPASLVRSVNSVETHGEYTLARWPFM